MLNYFTTLDSRGADSLAELDRQRAKTAQAICGLDADIIGLSVLSGSHLPICRKFAEHWIDDLVFATDGSLARAVEAAGAVPIGYRDLRAVMRAG